MAMVKKSDRLPSLWVSWENMPSLILWCLCMTFTLACSQPMTAGDAKAILDKHNEYRRMESAANMYLMHWNITLQERADGWAQMCDFKHEQNLDVGENLYFDTDHENEVFLRGLKMWHDEKNEWSYTSNACSTTCHYTQMVTGYTTTVGCSAKVCPSLRLGSEAFENAMLLVCYYYPRGNFVGHFPFEHGAPCSKCGEGDTCSNGLCVTNGQESKTAPDFIKSLRPMKPFSRHRPIKELSSFRALLQTFSYSQAKTSSGFHPQPAHNSQHYSHLGSSDRLAVVQSVRPVAQPQTQSKYHTSIENNIALKKKETLRLKELREREVQRKLNEDRQRRERERVEQERLETHRQGKERERLEIERKEREYRERQLRENERREIERIERERVEKERKELQRLDKERKERKYIEWRRREEERLELERKENESLEKERKEQERLEQVLVEQERIEQERREQERTEQERREQARVEQERREQERREQERREQERREQERLEQERVEQERIEQERIEQERIEQERIEQERIEQERREQEHREQERLEQERIEHERREQERIDQERREQERIEQERREKELVEQERVEQERVEQEREEQESLERERKELENVEPQRLEIEPSNIKHKDQEPLENEQERQERLERERKEHERVEINNSLSQSVQNSKSQNSIYESPSHHSNLPVTPASNHRPHQHPLYSIPSTKGSFIPSYPGTSSSPENGSAGTSSRGEAVGKENVHKAAPVTTSSSIKRVHLSPPRTLPSHTHQNTRQLNTAHTVRLPNNHRLPSISSPRNPGSKFIATVVKIKSKTNQGTNSNSSNRKTFDITNNNTEKAEKSKSSNYVNSRPNETVSNATPKNSKLRFKMSEKAARRARRRRRRLRRRMMARLKKERHPHQDKFVFDHKGRRCVDRLPKCSLWVDKCHKSAVVAVSCQLSCGKCGQHVDVTSLIRNSSLHDNSLSNGSADATVRMRRRKKKKTKSNDLPEPQALILQPGKQRTTGNKTPRQLRNQRPRRRKGKGRRKSKGRKKGSKKKRRQYTSEVCRDNPDYIRTCRYWTKRGFCEDNWIVRNVNCRWSCGECS